MIAQVSGESRNVHVLSERVGERGAEGVAAVMEGRSGGRRADLDDSYLLFGDGVLTTGAGVDFSPLPLLKNTKKIRTMPSTVAATMAAKLSSAMLGRRRGTR